VLDFEDPTEFVTDPNISANSSPYFILKKFMSADVIDEIVFQTNIYAVQKNISKWKDVTSEEFWRFFALNLLMGVVKKTNLKDHWSRNPLHATIYFNDTMSRNRYINANIKIVKIDALIYIYIQMYVV
jgi:hypothetical protein